MMKCATITLPVEVKKRLEEYKEDKTWGEFLLEMFTEWRRLRGEKAFKELRALLSDEDLESMRESSEEFRKNFSLR